VSEEARSHLPFADYLFTYVVVVGIVAELSLMLWLLVMGVKAERWQKQAEARP
jgi:hypothetical protein